MTEREKLAEYAHGAWSGWIEYMISKCRVSIGGELLIPKELEDRWKRQLKTSYADLPETEKESDRLEADKILAITKEGRHVLKALIDVASDSIELDAWPELQKAIDDGQDFLKSDKVIKNRHKVTWFDLCCAVGIIAIVIFGCMRLGGE